jgi:hypothetical protein
MVNFGETAAASPAVSLYSIHIYDYLAARVALFQVRDRRGHLLERILPVDYRRELTGPHQIGQNRQVIFVSFGKKDRELLANDP